jgi:NifU-like protein involved in Fe-S cluster formation
MAAQATGKSVVELDEARQTLRAFLAGERPDPGEWPGLSALSGARGYPARHAAILLPFDAVREAVAQARHPAAAADGMFARQARR